MASTDFSTIQESIKSKLHNAVDSSHVFSIFENLMTAVISQQDELKSLNQKMSDMTQQMADMGEKMNGINGNMRSYIDAKITKNNIDLEGRLESKLDILDEKSVGSQSIVSDPEPISPDSDDKKGDWRDKKPVIVQELQEKGREIRANRTAAEEAAESVENLGRKGGQTVIQRVRMLETRINTMTERLSENVRDTEIIQEQLNSAKDSTLGDEIAELKRFVEQLGKAVVDASQRALHAERELAEKNLQSMLSEVRPSAPEPVEDELQQERLVQFIREQLDKWAAENMLKKSLANSRATSAQIASRTSTPKLQSAGPPSRPDSGAIRRTVDVAIAGTKMELDHVKTMLARLEEKSKVESAKLKTEILELDRTRVTHTELSRMLTYQIEKESSTLSERFHSCVIEIVTPLVRPKMDYDEMVKFVEDSLKDQPDIIAGIVRDGCGKVERDVGDRMRMLDNKMKNLTKIMRELENAVRNSSTAAAEVSPMEDWKPEVARVGERLAKTEEDYQRIVVKLAEEIEALQDALGARPNESQVTQMVHSVEDAIRRQLGESNDDMSVTVSKLVNAVRSKANKEEVIRIVQERISQAEMQRAAADADEKDRQIAGSIKCISCGAPKFNDVYKEEENPPNPVLIPLVPQSKADYEQLVAVVNRNAGLKPLTRSYTPMAPKIHPYLQKQQKQQTPLYRRAQLAAQMKEVAKAQSSVLSSSAAMYYLDDGSSLDEGINRSRISTTSSNPSNVRLPSVQPLPMSDDLSTTYPKTNGGKSRE